MGVRKNRVRHRLWAPLVSAALVVSLSPVMVLQPDPAHATASEPGATADSVGPAESDGQVAGRELSGTGDPTNPGESGSTADPGELWPGQTIPTAPGDGTAEEEPAEPTKPTEPSELSEPSEPTKPGDQPAEETESAEQPGQDPPDLGAPGNGAPERPAQPTEPQGPAGPARPSPPTGAQNSSPDPQEPQAPPRETLTAGTVEIAGQPRVGGPLHVELTDWSAADTSFGYQWQSNGAAVRGATSREYSPTPGDLGQRLSVRVTATREGYATRTVASSVTEVVLPGTLAAAAPGIVGSAVVGETLTAEVAAWKPRTPKLSFRWKRDGRTIAGATTAEYRLVAADAGKRLTVTVRGALKGYSPAGRSSAPTGPVLRPLTATGAPRIGGAVNVGAPLTVKARTWRPAGSELSYQWLRDSTPISGATHAKYTPTGKDAGGKIAVQVTATKAGHQTISQESAALPVPRILRAAKPRVLGTALVGARLSVDRGSWTADCDYRYQWYRGGHPIPGATGAHYHVSARDTGLPLSVMVTGERRGYATESRVSGATAAVPSPGAAQPLTATPAGG